MIKFLGQLSAVAMPVFNIPLVLRVIRRGSSEDISLVWATGVWVCVIGMLPSSLSSTDTVLHLFGIVNAVFFSVVVVTVYAYHPVWKNRRSRRQ